MSPAATRSAPSPRAAGSVRAWPPPEGFWLGLAAAILLFGGHYLYGANDSRTTLALDILAALMVGGVLVHRGLRRDLLQLRDLVWPGAAFLMVILVGLWTLTPYVPGGPHPIWTYVDAPAALTIDKSSTIVQLINLLGLGCFFLLGAASGSSDRRARMALDLMLVGGVVFGLWAAIISAAGLEYQAQGRRLEAHFLTSNTAATLFGALFVLAVATTLRRLRAAAPSERIIGAAPTGAAALTFAICLVMTASRAGLTATLVSLAALLGTMMFAGRIRVTRLALSGLAIVSLLLVVVVAAGDRVIARFSDAGGAARVRAEMFAPHWDAFLASPLFGYGLGTYGSVNKSLLSASNFDALGDVRAAHNVYLQWLEGGGLVGALPMFVCIGLILGQTLVGAFRRSHMTTILFGLLAADLVFLLHGLTDVALESPSMAAFWAWLLGLQFALAKGSSSR